MFLKTHLLARFYCYFNYWDWVLFLWTYFCTNISSGKSQFYFLLTHSQCPLWLIFSTDHMFINEQRWFGRNKMISYVFILFPVGAWDFSPLSKHTFPIGGHTSRPAGWHEHRWEAGKEQTASPLPRERREAGTWAPSRQICGVLCTHAGMSTSHYQIC